MPSPTSRAISALTAKPDHCLGENVGHAWGEPTFDPKEGLRIIHQNMMNEGPGGGHYDNIMSPDFQQVGVGVAFDANHVWVTEDFITP
jgi:hypothetical protein